MGGKTPKCSSMDEWTNKKVINTCNGTLFSFKKGERNSEICYNMDEP